MTDSEDMTALESGEVAVGGQAQKGGDSWTQAMRGD